MKWVFTLFFLFVMQYGVSEAQTTGKYKYCQIYYNNPCYSDSYFNIYYPDRTEKNVSGSLYEVMNKLGSQGWELVTSTVRDYDCGTEYEYIFKLKM